MTGPDPAVARARSAVRAVLDDDAVVPPGALVLVACSGGPDSLALAAATAFVAPRTGRRAGAVVVDHGLQPGSDDVARTAADACRGLGLHPVEVVAVDAASGTGGPEARARTARYAALEATASRHGAAVVLLGHTLDDQAEGVLLGLARGSGARSLGGMPRRRGRFVRPFLGLRRAQTRRVCEVLGLRPWHDPTNDDGDGPLRSRVRTRVLPVLEETLGPGVAEALARTAGQLRADADVLDELAAHLLADARPVPPAGDADGRAADDGAVVELDVARLAQAPEAVRRRALQQAVTGAGAPGGAVGEVHVRAVDALVTDWRGQGPVHLPGGVRAERRCGRLTLHEPTDDREH